MKIVKNTSAFDTRWLRSLFCKVHRIQSRYEGKCRAWGRLKVTVRGAGRLSDRGSGHAYIGTGPIVLTVGDGRDSRALEDGSLVGQGITTRRLSGLFWHEMTHVYGYRSHRGGRCDPQEKYLDEICDGLPERPPLKQPVPSARENIVQIRYDRIVSRQQNWDKKLNRAKAALLKVKRERRRYELLHRHLLPKATALAGSL